MAGKRALGFLVFSLIVVSRWLTIKVGCRLQQHSIIYSIGPKKVGVIVLLFVLSCISKSVVKVYIKRTAMSDDDVN